MAGCFRPMSTTLDGRCVKSAREFESLELHYGASTSDGDAKKAADVPVASESGRPVGVDARDRLHAYRRGGTVCLNIADHRR